MFSRRGRPIDLVRFHRRQIEEKDDQTPVLELARSIGSDLGGFTSRLCGLSCQRLRLCDILTRYSIDTFHVERNDFLWLVVFKQCEIFRLESLNEIAIAIPDRHVDQHKIALHAEGVVGVLLRLQGDTRKRQHEEQRQSLAHESWQPY